MAVFSEVVNMVSATVAGHDNKTGKTTLKLPEDCKMLRRIWIDAVSVGTAAANKAVLGYVKVSSKDIDGIRPCHLPLEPQSGFLGTGGGAMAREPHKWVINRATKKGPTLEFVSVVDIAPNGAVELMIHVEYSSGEPVPDEPLNVNYQIAELATTGSVASAVDNGTDAGAQISLKGPRMILDVFVYAGVTILTADEALALECEIESSDFKFSGPHKMIVNGASVIDATNAVQPIHGGISFLSHAIDKKDQVDTVNVDATLTSRDAQSTGATWNWGIAYV